MSCAIATGCRAACARNMRKIENAMNALQQKLGRPPLETEVAKQLKLSLGDYQDMLGDSGGHQLVYYEDFHDTDTKEHFLDHYCSDMSGDPFAGPVEW